MTQAIDIFATYWFYFMFISFALGIIGFGCLVYRKHGKPENPNKLLKIGGFLFGQVLITWIIGFGCLLIVQSNARSEFKEFLLNEGINLSINGRKLIIGEEKELIEILKTVRGVPAHHSSPTKEIIIILEHDANITTVYLKEDSRIENEYWVFWDRFFITKNNEIGRITNKNIRKLITNR